MKESSRERLANVLMDELMERLGSRDAIKKMLGDMTSWPIEEVLDHLMTEFEKVVADYHAQNVRDRGSASEKQNRPQTTPVAPVEQVASPAKVAVPHEPIPVEARVEQPAPTKGKKSVPPPEPPAPPTMSEAASPRESVKLEVAPVQRVPPPPLKLVSRAETAVNDSAPDARAVITELKGKETQTEDQPGAEPSPRPEPRHAAPAPVEKELPKVMSKVEPKESPVKLDPIKVDFPRVTLREELSRPVVVHEEEPKPIAGPPRKERSKEEAAVAQQAELNRLAELARSIEAEYSARMKQEATSRPEPEQRRLPEPEPVIVAPVDLPVVLEEESVEPGTKRSSRSICTFAENDFVYVHAVSRIPEGEAHATEPFTLEEKGIDGHAFAFVFDYQGLRFFLSKINPNEMSISKAMVLLLNKQESLELQGVHESVLNDLRAHGMLLPVEFGTVVRGKEQLCDIVDINKDDLDDALDDLDKTTWWTVTAFVLDATIAGIVGTDVKTVGRDRQRDRASYTSAAQSKKFDIKVLERILQREKKLAEAIHDGLCSVAEKSDLDTIVGLGSGSSEDWKLILKGAYFIPKKEIAKFNRAVTDLQYHHMQYELMLTLTGKKDCISLRRK